MNETAPLLEIEELRVRRGARELGPWSTAIRAGEVQQWCGPNGSGKSSLIEVVSGLLPPTSGRVRIVGREIERNVDPYRRDVTLLLQEIGLWPRRPIASQIALVRGHAKIDPKWDFDAVTRTLGIEAFAKRRPESLSVGEQQRCALARALAKPASVVLLDEPLSAQDEASRQQVEAVIELVRESGAAVVVASHLPVGVATNRFDIGG